MARSLRILVVLIGLGALLLAPRAAAQEAPVVEIAPTARLLQGGKAVAVQVTVTCPAGAEVLEAFLYVNQDGNQGQFAFFQPICDGSPHTFTVRAQAVGFRYHVGQAQVSGYVLLTSGASTSPSQTVTVHRGPG
jgi:predicted RNA-binding protein with TRAM domain